MEEMFFRKEATSSVILKEISFNRATISYGENNICHIDINPLSAESLKKARALLTENKIVLCDYDCWNKILSNFR